MVKKPLHFRNAVKGMRRPLAVVLSLAMVLGSVPVGAVEALAAELDNAGATELNDAALLAQAEDTASMSVESTEDASAPKAAASETTLTYEDEALMATVSAPAGVLPAGARVEVEEIHPTTIERADAYGEALSALSETLHEQDKVYTAAKVYDIRLIDADGVEFEPAGEVSVALNYKQALPMGDASAPVEVAHVTDAGKLEMMDADVATNRAGDLTAAEFTTTGFSYYIVFQTNEGSESEPINYGDYGWLKFATPSSSSDWGHYQSESDLPATNTEEGYHRILQVRLHTLNTGGDETAYDTDYTYLTNNQYFWTWENSVYISDFYVPGYEVVQTKMHTAWDDSSEDTYQDSLVGSYSVRGYRSSDGASSDLNVLDVYMKAIATPENAMRYIVRYVHADGSVSDGNVRYLSSGSVTLDVDKPRDGEVFSGIAVAAGVEAVTADSTAKTVTFTYDSKVNLAKAYVYFEADPVANASTTKERYDKTAEGKYYNGEKGLYTDKSAEKVDDREFLVNLEAWYVDNSASVGMVLDASGSMAWTAGVPTVYELTDEQVAAINTSKNSASNALSAADVNKLLDITECDNTNNGYNGYKYYVYTQTLTTSNPINEYAAIGYTDGNTSTATGRNNTSYTTTRLGTSGNYKGTVQLNKGNGAGWYFVNSGTDNVLFGKFGAKRYEGLYNAQGPCKFYVKQENGKYYLYCHFSQGSNKADGPGSAEQDSKVYVKRDQMMTKSETLQDSIAQFGAILNGASPLSEMSAVRYSHTNFPSNLVLLNWTNDSEDIAAAMDLTANAAGGTARSDGTYQYGITGGTKARYGFAEFANKLKSHADSGDNYKYLILFTDGKDQGTSTNEITNKNYLNTTFPGYTIITMFMRSVGMSDTDVAASRTFLQGLADGGKGGNPNAKLYYEASSDNASEVVEQFRQIANHIVTGLQDYSVRDYIDPRFDVVNEAGQVLSVLDSDGEFKHSTNADVDATTGFRGFTTPDGKQAQLGYDPERKMFYVLWQHQEIQASAIGADGQDSTVYPWKSQIRLVAKGDFIGGNDVLTNGNDADDNLVYKPTTTTTTTTDEYGNTVEVLVPTYDSYGREIVDTTATSKSFPFASVNPGLLDVALSNYEDTIFLGETITPGELLSNMTRTGTPASRITDETSEKRRVADSVYNTPAMTDAGDTDQSSIWYVEYLERLGYKLHGDTEYYFTLLKHVNLTGAGGVQPIIEAVKANSANYTVTEATGSVVIEGNDDTDAEGEKITITKNSKIELELPYYYLECPTDNSSYAGPTTTGTDPMEDRVGTLTYTWEVKDFAGNKVFADSKSEGNKFVQFDTYVDSSHHMTTGDPAKDVTASVKYQFSIAYVPTALSDDAKADGSGSSDTQGDGSERTRALIGKTDSTADRVASLIRNVPAATAVSAVEGKQNTTSEQGWAVIHAVDGRILIEKKMLTTDFNKIDELGLTGTMTFTLTGNGIALNDDGTAKNEVVWTKTLALEDATSAKTSGDYTYLTLADNWAEGLPMGTYTLTETTTGAVKYVTIAAEDVEFDTSDTTDPAGPYDGTASKWAAANTGAITYYIGTVNNGTPASTSYADTDYSYDVVTGTTGTYKQIDPALNEGNGKAYLNAQLGHAVVENELRPTRIDVTKTWEDADCIPTDDIVIKIWNESDTTEVYYVPLAATGSQTWSGTTGEVIPLSSATYVAQEGKGICTLNEETGIYSCDGFEALGDTFELNTSDGKKQFAKTGETYVDVAETVTTGTDTVAINVANGSTLAEATADVSVTWPEDSIPEEGVVVRLVGNDAVVADPDNDVEAKGATVVYVTVAATEDATWTATSADLVAAGASGSVTFTATVGRGTGTSFVALSDGAPTLALKVTTRTTSTSADHVTANTAPLAGTVEFTNGKIKTSIELIKVDAQDYATALAKAQEDLADYNASKSEDDPVKTVADFLVLDSVDTLEGATFQLKKADGTLVGDAQTTGEDGTITFSNLQPSTDYVITETSAPTGWSRREDIALTVASDGTVAVTTDYVASDSMAPTLGNPDASLKYPLTVPNTRTYMLPAAGGPGVYPFLLAGAFAAAYAASGASDERRRLSGRKANRRAAGPLGGD